jgi:hypothetical protein
MGVVVAISTAMNGAVQRIDMQTARFRIAGEELNEKIVTASSKLYDPATTKSDARAILAQLDGAAAKR